MITFEMSINLWNPDLGKREVTVKWVNAPSEDIAEGFADMVDGRITGVINSKGVEPEFGQVDYTIHK